MKKKIVKKTIQEKVVFAIAFIIFVLYAFTIFYAFAFLIISALKTNEEFVMHMFELPKQWLFGNFVSAFEKLQVRRTNMWGMLVNSAWYTVGGTLLSVGCATTLSYVVSKYSFFGKNLIYAISIVVLVLPIVGSLPATYKLVMGLGLDNSPFYLIVFTSGFGFNFIVLYGFFQNLSWSYAEAAYIDGCTHSQTFFKIVLPLLKPIISTMVILNSLAFWNDYLLPSLILTDKKLLTLPLSTYSFYGTYSADYGTIMAGLLLCVLPILILYVILQKQIIGGVVAGAVK